MTVYSGAAAAVALAITCGSIARARRWRRAYYTCEARCRQLALFAPRTPEVARQLQQSRKMEAIGRLAGGIAHDFNNLLTAITGYAELIAVGLQPADPVIQDVYEIRRAALSAGRLTRQLLAFSANQRVRNEVLDLNAIVARTTGLLRRTLGGQITVTLALDPDIKPVKADAGQIEQVVLNLAVNARDAMPDGGRLTVTTATADGLVRLTVADTGCGMSEETQSRAFEPFFTTKDGTGNGIGLATVYGIVAQSHGHIALTSAPGAGTTFTIDLPPASEPLPVPVSAPTPRLVDGYATVLIVEDDPGVRQLVEVVLRRAGYEVLSVAGPSDALAALSQTDFHLVLIDIVMPEMTGYDLAAEIRKTSPEVRVVFMSGFACDPLRQPVREPFLAKPFTVESLTTVVQQALGAAA
jgi:CheY-like chemotaxis protein/two-component sensor histidine kinase